MCTSSDSYYDIIYPGLEKVYNCNYVGERREILLMLLYKHMQTELTFVFYVYADILTFET